MAKKPTTTKKRIILLDTHAILHRAYHALPDFSSSKGEPIGGLYGLATMILKIIEDFKPQYVIACYDLPGKTYRHEAYTDYKGGRAKIDDNLVAQIIRSRDLFTAFSIPMYDKPGFEADDMLGTIAEQLKHNNDVEVIIASGDMDTMQLVDDNHVMVYTLRKGIKDTVLYDEKAVFERYGFSPLQLPDYKGLRGDPSDNIIGIKGIGDKTATILIQKFGTIEGMYKALKKDKAKFKKDSGMTDRIVGLIEEGEEEATFSKMLATIRRDAPIEFKIPDHEWKAAVDMKKVEELFKALEFRSLGVRVKEVLGLSDAFGDDLAEAPAGQTGIPGTTEEVDPIQLRTTALALSVLNPEVPEPTLEDILSYAKADTFSKARENLLEEIEKRNLSRVYKEIELPLIPILDEMHTWGIKVDTDFLKELSKTYHKELEKLQKEIYEHAGGEFNINSPKQLGEILFVKMGLKAKGQKKTAGGAMSTRESELEKLKELHPIIECILDYRELQKLLSTYIDSLPHLVADDGRVHTRYVSIGAATGRMASKDPNLQNIPIKSELGRNIRKAFVAEKGFTLAALDYSQIELRLAAILSGDIQLVDIFKSGRDVHTEVAARVFKVPAEKVDKEMRRKAKVINFGILYGMGVNALRANLGKGTSRDEAQLFYNEYFNTFKELAAYLGRVKGEAARNGYTETMFGRRRYFEGINSKLPFIKAAAERMAINAPIQGSQADIIKLAMIKVAEYVKEQNIEKDARMLLQVHDELIFEIKKDLVESFTDKVRDIMQNILTKNQTKGIPILANCNTGGSWGDMKEL